jgi:predicted transposase YbfD/YdcC
MIHVLGVLPIFLFNTKTIYNTFTYEEYGIMINDCNISKDIDLDSSNITNDEKLKQMFYKIYFLYKKFRYFMLKVNNKNFDCLIIFIKCILDELYKNYTLWEKLDKQKQLEEVVQSYWEIELTKQQITESKNIPKNKKNLL